MLGIIGGCCFMNEDEEQFGLIDREQVSDLPFSSVSSGFACSGVNVTGSL